MPLRPDLFDALRGIVSSGQWNVRALEAADVLSGAIFASEFIPTGGPAASREQARHDWLGSVRRKLDAVDLLFLDPDDGLEPPGYRPLRPRAGSIMPSELQSLATWAMPDCVSPPISPARTHYAEMLHWGDCLLASGFTTVDALRARLYFLLDAPARIRERAGQIAVGWKRCITWHLCRDRRGG